MNLRTCWKYHLWAINENCNVHVHKWKIFHSTFL